MPLLRRRLVCFYCGCRSAKSHPAGTRQWECEKCDAVNHLDENGEITDPPATSSQTDSRFARSAPRSISPEISPSEDSLFCTRCLTNQHLFTQTLASYLPATTDPEYPAYENNYPKYRKQLEERYPQVCQNCEPRVRERLRVTGYAAKTDHLRRMVEQTRNGKGRRLRAWGWQDNVVALAEICWWMSLLVQLAWHSLSIIKGPPQDDLRSADWDDTLSACVCQSLGSEPLEPTCTIRYSTIAGYALSLGLLCAWWNPQLRRKLRGNVGRMVGLTEYYKLQVIFIVIRSAAWGLLVKAPAFSADPQTSKAAHAFMLAFTILSIVVSYRTVLWDPTPLVSFRENNEPLIPPQSTQQSSEPKEPQPNLPTQVHHNFGQLPAQLQPPKPRFDINSLAPNPQRPYQPAPYNPPTPPPEDDNDPDSMDWTPSHSVPSAKPYRSAASIAAEATALRPPNPFYGTLPPRPLSEAHRLRNPISQAPGPLTRASAQQENFFRRQPQPSLQTTTPKKPRGVNGLSSMQLDDTFSPSSETASEAFSPRKASFAQPRFFPKSDYENDTGLENLFGKVFSLGEEPARDTDAATEDEEEEAETPIEQRRGIPGLEARPRPQPRQRERRSLLRAEVVIPVLLLAFVAQIWWFDVESWGRLARKIIGKRADSEMHHEF